MKLLKCRVVRFDIAKICTLQKSRLSMFAPLLSQLNDLRRHTARFRRVALHLHSPDSHDWGRNGDAARNHRDRFAGPAGLDEYAKELAAHLDVAAVTDHMRCDFATRLSATREHLVVLPGMEVNLRIEPLGFARIHLVTVLPEGSSTDAFACLLANQPQIPKEDANRTGNEEVVGLTLKGWVERVHNEGGLCIAAHVESNNGVRSVFRQVAQDVLKLFTEASGAEVEKEHDVPEALKDYLFDSGLDAVEIHRTGDGQHYRWLSQRDGQSRSIATLLTFDAHCCEAFGRTERITHVKMTSLGILGLRNALRFPDTRIRFPHNLPTAPNPRLLGISIKGDDGSFFKDVTIALAENLNCVIGVRGSGKSTIVEALRYIFGYNRTLNDLGKAMADGIREMQRANLKGSIIRVAYRLRSGEDRILQATFDEKSDYVTKVYSLDGEQIEVADVEDCGEYPLRLFGWSEIETLGRNPARQRDLLDRLIHELGPVIRRREAIRQQLKTNRGDISKCLSELSVTFEKNGSHVTRFREYKADFEKLNTESVRTLFASLDLARSKRRLLEQVRSNVDERLDEFENLSTISLRTNIDELLSQGSDALREWWLGSELQSLGTAAAETEVSALSRQAVERLTAFRTLLVGRIESNSREIEKIEQDLQKTFDEAGDDSMQRIADLRANAERRLNAVSETRRHYLAIWKSLQDAIGIRDRICQELVQVQNEIAGIRARHNQNVEATLNRFLPRWMKVSILFRPGADKAAFVEHIPTICPGRSNAAAVAKVRKCIEQGLNPVTCAEMIFKSAYGNLLAMPAATDNGLTNSDLESWKAKSSPFEQNEHAEIPVLAENGSRLTATLDMQETAWDDYATILLDGGPVNEKSPGQRASAMLPLIALAEETPIVIDQPEDNLDKRLIGTVLMQVLAELKEKRQITVCTHDPNILVGGDAEQVVVLKAESNRRGVVEDHGSIDNEKIVQTVIDLLEGGKEAFEARRRRYGLDGENAETAKKQKARA